MPTTASDAAPPCARATVPNQQSVDALAASAHQTLAQLQEAWRGLHVRAVEREHAALARADKLAQLLTPAAAIAAAYVDRVHQPDLRDEALALLDEIRRLPR